MDEQITNGTTQSNARDNVDNDVQCNYVINNNKNRNNVIKIQTLPITVRIEERDLAVWNRFKDYVYVKYRTTYGHLGRELITAIELYLEPRSKQQHTTFLTNSKIRADVDLKVKVIRKALLDWSIENNGDIVIPETALVKTIREATGIQDRRSVKHYIQILLDQGVQRKHNLYHTLFDIEHFIHPNTGQLKMEDNK